MSRGFRPSALAGALSCAIGCAAEDPPTIVGLLGCGLEGDVFTTLRVEARGDFPPDSDSQILVSSGIGDLDADPDAIAGVTVEGLFGDTVTAVGRTSRLSDHGDIPVYFAPADQWCAVVSSITLRDPGSLEAGPDGNIVVVGGRDRDGSLLADIVTLRDDTGVAVALDASLPAPSVGHSVHALGGQRFVVVGGASGGEVALDSVVHIDLTDSRPVSGAMPIPLAASFEPARAFHGALTLPDGRILVTGGCGQVESDGRCVDATDAGADIRSSSFWIAERAPGEFEYAPGPLLTTPRYGHALHLARDGVVFVAGGWRGDGTPAQQPERLLDGAERFEPYGPELNLLLPADLGIDDSTLLEGGMVVLATADGGLWWITPTEAGRFAQWCEEGTGCFEAPVDPTVVLPAHRVTALPGERVLADGWILPLGGIGQTGADALDLSSPSLQVSNPPPPARIGAEAEVLADGSALIAGGRDPITGELAPPFFVRLRPELDGPDEHIPDVDDLSPGSLVALQPDRIDLQNPTTIRMLSAGLAETWPSVRARARGFRSAQFRFEVTLSADEADPHIILEQGAVAGMSIRFQDETETGADGEPAARVAVRAFLRGASGIELPISCGSAEFNFDTPQVMRIEVTPETIVIRRGADEIAQCPAVGDVPSAVGIGVSGSGTVRASALRLTRI